ncbi:uncharacterized protein LOC102809039 [Saccoglossus kowalevskii]|uniref:Uncharacterized protein LOC102809039 n=1 Tax=Saccoglossus kowalevskii TaxID=10224 RepID=A0ABM0M976_SACKO|nr:PREDICTED: uncharacterized protein LOC102809039 [Saccoglossus kowalevskii]
MPTSSRAVTVAPSKRMPSSRPLPKRTTSNARATRGNSAKGASTRIPIPVSDNKQDDDKKKEQATQKMSKVRRVPDFNKLHKNWNTKLQIGKACTKKPMTQVHEFDLTKPGTKFHPAVCRDLLTDEGTEAEKDEDFFELDQDALNSIVDSRALQEREDSKRPTIATDRVRERHKESGFPFQIKPISEESPTRQVLGSLSAGTVNNNNRNIEKKPSPVTKEIVKRKEDPIKANREAKSLADQQKDSGIDFESDNSALASILNNQGVDFFKQRPKAFTRQTMGNLPRYERLSVYNRKSQNTDNIYKEFWEHTYKRLTMTGSNISTKPVATGEDNILYHIALRVLNPKVSLLQEQSISTASPNLPVRKTKYNITKKPQAFVSPNTKGPVKWADLLTSPENDKAFKENSLPMMNDDTKDYCTPYSMIQQEKQQHELAAREEDLKHLREVEEAERLLELEIKQLEQNDLLNVPLLMKNGQEPSQPNIASCAWGTPNQTSSAVAMMTQSTHIPSSLNHSPGSHCSTRQYEQQNTFSTVAATPTNHAVALNKTPQNMNLNQQQHQSIGGENENLMYSHGSDKQFQDHNYRNQPTSLQSSSYHKTISAIPQHGLGGSQPVYQNVNLMYTHGSQQQFQDHNQPTTLLTSQCHEKIPSVSQYSLTGLLHTNIDPLANPCEPHLSDSAMRPLFHHASAPDHLYQQSLYHNQHQASNSVFSSCTGSILNSNGYSEKARLYEAHVSNDKLYSLPSHAQTSDLRLSSYGSSAFKSSAGMQLPTTAHVNTVSSVLSPVSSPKVTASKKSDFNQTSTAFKPINLFPSDTLSSVKSDLEHGTSRPLNAWNPATNAITTGQQHPVSTDESQTSKTLTQIPSNIAAVSSQMATTSSNFYQQPYIDTKQETKALKDKSYLFNQTQESKNSESFSLVPSSVSQQIAVATTTSTPWTAIHSTAKSLQRSIHTPKPIVAGKTTLSRYLPQTPSFSKHAYADIDLPIRTPLAMQSCSQLVTKEPIPLSLSVDSPAVRPISPEARTTIFHDNRLPVSEKNNFPLDHSSADKDHAVQSYKAETSAWSSNRFTSGGLNKACSPESKSSVCSAPGLYNQKRIQGSLSLGANMRSKSPVGLHSLKHRTIGNQHFHDALLDSEVALSTCRSLSKFSAKPRVERNFMNPVAKILDGGDDMHFIPIKEVFTNQALIPDGSAFSTYTGVS